MQKVLAFALPPFGIFVLGWALYYSRGAYRLENNLLSVPGHAPIRSTLSARSTAPTGTARDRLVNYELPSASPAALPRRLHLPAQTHRRHLQANRTYTGTGESRKANRQRLTRRLKLNVRHDDLAHPLHPARLSRRQSFSGVALTALAFALLYFLPLESCSSPSASFSSTRFPRWPWLPSSWALWPS